MARSIAQKWTKDEHTEVRSGGISEKRADSSRGERYRWGRVEQVVELKCLGLEVKREGGATGAVKQRIKAAWMKWQEVAGIICSRRMPKKLECKMYGMVVRPVLMYGAECWTMVKKDKDLMSGTEMRMLRWILGGSRLKRIRNEEIRRRCGVADIVEKMQEARLRWMSHVLRRKGRALQGGIGV